jgi:3-oxoacyl-[acyl-carrier protein] reductase
LEYGLFGKVALVTGVSRSIGIGAAVARGLAAAGAHVFTTYYRPYDQTMAWGSAVHEAGAILEELRAAGVKADGLEADLGDPDAVAQIFNRAEESVGPVDILINNATVDYLTDLYGLTADLLDAHYAVNVRGTVLLCAELARRHNGRPGGRIINLTSGQGIGPMPDNLPYAITKGAVEALTTSLSASLAKKRITVNAVDPGATDTGWMDSGLRAELEAMAVFGRIGTPEDAMRIILFLVSAQAQWVTGQVIHSRGGM